MPEGVIPTITDRDFEIGNVVAPTILVEPEKTEEVPAEGEAVTEGAEGTPTTEEGGATDDKTKAAAGEKGKTAKPTEEKGKAPQTDKGQATNKEKETKKK